jgi:uncharacterized protein YprB with RNaseH-like and TPR domain
VSTLAERLRDVIRPGQSEGRPLRSSDDAVDRHGDDAAEILGGVWQESRGQRFIVIDRKYSPGHRHGRVVVADCLPQPDGTWPGASLLAGAACSGRMLFVDVETTGLAGGAGSYAFLVGCGWFDGAVFRVRQFFLANFAAERGLLEGVAAAADAAGALVTYNGKSFDMPLMETRFALHRMETPFAELAHLDMLHPARRLWREGGTGESGLGTRDPWFVEGSGARAPGPGSRALDPVSRPHGAGDCRLSALEWLVCGHRREDDVPGFEIPSRYFHYVRSGDARALEMVMEHNRLDLLALALVTARASQLLDDGPAAARSAREALGMGRLYERGGLDGQAQSAYDRAATMDDGDAVTRAEALRGYAALSRRHRRYEDAASAWRRILELRGAPPTITREATHALAVHHEHRLRDPRSARTFALQSMNFASTLAKRDAVEHRLARLDRKLGHQPAGEPTLFS